MCSCFSFKAHCVKETLPLNIYGAPQPSKWPPFHISRYVR